MPTKLPFNGRSGSDGNAALGLQIVSRMWPLVLGLACVLTMTGTQTAAAETLAIVANQRYPIDQLTLSQVQDIYLGRKQIERYLRIRPVDQSDPFIRAAFLNTVLHRSKETYINHWKQQMYREGGIPPMLRHSPDALIKELVKTDGAIGYLWLSKAKTRQELKILLEIPVR